MCTHHKQGFNLCVYAKPAFAIQTSRPQPITTNPITVYMQHLISRKVCSGLCEQCRDSNEHTLPIVRACQCVCMSPCWLTRRLFPGLARRHVWLAACRFHHIAPETEADLVASSPTGLSLSVSPPLCLSSSLSLSVPRCLPLSPIEPSFEASVGWLWFCLAGQAVGKHFDWRDRTKAHTAIFEAAVLVRKMVSQMIRTWQRNPREDTNAHAYGMVYSCDNRSADRNSCGTCNVCRSKQTSLSLASSSICFSIF